MAQKWKSLKVLQDPFVTAENMWKKQEAFASIISMLKKGNTFYHDLLAAVESTDHNFYSQQRHWRYIRETLLSASARLDNTKLSREASRSLRSNNIQGVLTNPNNELILHQDNFGQEVSKVLEYTEGVIGDSEYLWLG